MALESVRFSWTNRVWLEGDRLPTVTIGHSMSRLPLAHVLFVRELLTSRRPLAKHEVLPRGRVDILILAAARRTAGAGRQLNALLILMWLPLALRGVGRALPRYGDDGPSPTTDESPPPPGTDLAHKTGSDNGAGQYRRRERGI